MIAPGTKLGRYEIRSKIGEGVKADGPTLEVGTPKALFDVRVPTFDSAQAQFDVTADGQKFLVANTAGEITWLPINVVLNWTADLKK